jgi:hypothetical protein
LLNKKEGNKMAIRNSPDNTFVWEEIPPKQDGRSLWHTQTQNALMSSPGKSARIKKYSTKSSALTSAANLRKRWPNDFTIVTRGDSIYATFNEDEF